eukprot:scaffold207380_cov78-Cyclotella_meneghiniana.AAC.1
MTQIGLWGPLQTMNSNLNLASPFIILIMRYWNSPAEVNGVTSLLIIGRRADCPPKWRPRTPDLPHYGSGVWLGLRTCAREWPRNILHLLNV